MVDLSKEEIENIESEARKEAATELKKQKMDALKEQYKAKAKEELQIEAGANIEGRETLPITIELPDSCTHLSTNGVKYRHGHTYYLTAEVHADILARVAKAWEHHKETRDGKSSLFFSQPRRRKN